MGMDTQKEILALIEAHLKKHKMPPSKFGRLHRFGSAFVSRLRSGKGLRSDTIDRLKAVLQK